MAGFDPELYLRLLGERMLVRDHRGAVGIRLGDLFEAASALVTCGVMDSVVAWRVLDDYSAAFGSARFRAGLGPTPPGPGSAAAARTDPAAAAAGPLAARRVFVTEVGVDSRHGLGRLSVHWIILTDTRITVCLTATVPSPSTLGAAAPWIELTTPDGQQLHAAFCDVVEPGLSGDFEAGASVRPDADWLMIDGTRVDLVPSPVAVDICVESIAPADPAIALVWQLMADFNDGRSWAGAGRAAIDALVAAGRIAADDPEVAALAWVRAHAPRTGRGETPAPTGFATAPPASVPEEWRGLARSRAMTFAGRSRTVAVGAATPVFDGLAVAVDVVDWGIWGVLIKLEVAGLDRVDPWSQLQRRPLAFWARDDRGNYSLGRRQSWSQAPDSDVGHGTVVFAPLHPATTRLTVTASTATARASIEIPL